LTIYYLISDDFVSHGLNDDYLTSNDLINYDLTSSLMI